MKKLKWHEEFGIIHFTVTSEGYSGAEWLGRLLNQIPKMFEERGSEALKDVLLSPDFTTTDNVPYEVYLLRVNKVNIPGEVWTYGSQIAQAAVSMGLENPSPEAMCLIWQKLSDENLWYQMDVYSIDSFHKPIKDSRGCERQLHMNRELTPALRAKYGIDEIRKVTNHSFTVAFVKKH